ncbi:MAG: redoxin domain-containing protein [Bryobacteraceae bacterium]
MRRTNLLATILVAMLAQGAFGQASREKIDVSKLGPQVGEKVPDFSLKDQYGNAQTLKSIMGPKGAMLVFVRSADWCPYCKTQLVDLQSGIEQVRKQGLGVATISYDPVEILAGFTKQHGITYTMLADVGSATIRKFGLLNPVPEWALDPALKDDPQVQAAVQKYVSVVRPTAAMVGIAFPGNIIVDTEGRVKQRFFEDFYIERNTVSSMMLKLGGAASDSVPATKVSTAHLDITGYPSTTGVAPGHRFTVNVDINPHAKIHVYAPGAKDYRVIGLKIDSSPEIAVLAQPKYPASEIYYVKPLKERVPVFQKPFRLIQDVVLNGTPQAQAALRGRETVTVKGSLEYQACDDKQCFNPMSVPLTWTVSVKSLVLQRPTPATTSAK